MEITKKILESLDKIKKLRPIVHHMTNNVTMNDCANITLSIGASPIMGMDKGEVEEIVAFSSSLVLNIGTFTQNNLQSMILAGKKANDCNIPVILDPVGVGATKLRSETVKILLDHIQFSIIKGNMSEIKSLTGRKYPSKGVDNNTDDYAAVEILSSLAKSLHATICATGAIDMITDGNSIYTCHNGHPILSQLTGTGCMTASLIGAFAGVETNSLIAALGGIVTMGIAGQNSHSSLSSTQGIGSFKVHLFDSIYNMNAEILEKGVSIHEL